MADTILTLTPATNAIATALGLEHRLLNTSFPGADPVPDVILTEERATAADFEGSLDTEVFVLPEPCSAEDVFENILSVGNRFDVSSRASELTEELRERVEIVRHKLKFVDNRPGVLWISSFESPNVPPALVCSLIETGGGTPLSLAGSTPAEMFANAVQDDPAVVIVAVPGLSIEQTLAGIGSLLSIPGMQDTAAAKNSRICIADGRAWELFSGPAVVDLLEMIAEMVQAGQFVFGFEGSGWLKFEI